MSDGMGDGELVRAPEGEAACSNPECPSHDRDPAGAVVRVGSFSRGHEKCPACGVTTTEQGVAYAAELRRERQGFALDRPSQHAERVGPALAAALEAARREERRSGLKVKAGPDGELGVER